MTVTAHDDAVGEVPIDTGSVLPPGMSLISGRAWRYTVPDNGASGQKDDLGWTTTQNGTTTTPVPTTADLRQSMLRNQMTSSAANTLVGLSQDPGVGASIFRGDATGIGGFFFLWRLSFPQVQADSIIRIGLTPSLAAGGAEPSALANTCVIGADSGDANVTIITVDNGGTANKSASIMTKASLATGDPRTNLSRVLDFAMYAPPNSGSIIATIFDVSNNAYILAPTNALATITTRLPLNTVALRANAACSTKTAAALTQALIHAYGYY